MPGHLTTPILQALARLIPLFLLAGCAARPVDAKAESLRRSGLVEINALASALFRSTGAIVAGQRVTSFTVDLSADRPMTGHVEVADSATPYATGCAIAIGFDRYLTAAHVVDTPPITVLRIDGRGQPHALPATVVWADSARDLAVVTASGFPDETSLTLAVGPPAVGDMVAVNGCWGSLSAGKVVDVQAGRDRFLCAAPVVGGDSGGAIVDRQGRLVGVISGGARRNGADYTLGMMVRAGDVARSAP